MSAPTAPVPLIVPTLATMPLRDTPRFAPSGLVFAVGSAFAFSSSGPLMKPLLEAGWSVSAVLLVRMTLAGLVLSPALVRAIRLEPGFLRRHAMTILAFGATGVAGCQILYFSAMQRMPVAMALLIQYLAPVLLVAVAWVRTRRSPSRLVLTGSVLAIAGLVLVVDVTGARFDVLGTVFALGAAVCVAAYFVIAERAGDRLPALALASGGLLVGAAVMALVGVTGLLPLHAAFVDVTFAGVAVPWFVPLAWVGLVATSLGYGLGIAAVPRIGSRVASFVGLSEVLFALLFAALLLGELPGPVQYVGAAVLLTGVVLVRLDARPAQVSAPSARGR
ncbi:threonine and homoserine efflux system [Microbacterium ginsengisoli]|uniref:EamA family transporter n=1 Tax=Microbacterium ginsengisoli TaxID=400772 RepID=A0A0F0LSY9_9MICO|nr:EamA family transporter [Microbacterium ginsengisoli]KJL35819.1 threonine and homoserine efflux system [Microbacterium ginsengisoli]MBN9208856.1 EamA family transporter [Microbacterium ginsengisoli]HAN23411.1 EamA family transporter [Microbacterium ginsengisoli]